jgi:NAD(P)-dependent dehydrogenase (short-subunit alcohol dehydrogenase family)
MAAHTIGVLFQLVSRAPMSVPRSSSDLAVTARSADAVEALAGQLRRAGTRAVAVPADLTDRESLRALTDRGGEEFGGLDVLVNNAGMLPAAVLAGAVGWAEWDQVMGLNLSAPWYLACRAKELMGEGGVVVNNASTASYYPSRGLVAYNVSKAALVMLTRVLALEWARDGVRVVGVAPGKIDTELVQPILRWTEKTERPLNPMRRIGQDHEVADLVAFLASPQAGFITGVTVPIDGGELLTAGSETGR